MRTYKPTYWNKSTGESISVQECITTVNYIHSWLEDTKSPSRSYKHQIFKKILCNHHRIDDTERMIKTTAQITIDNYVKLQIRYYRQNDVGITFMNMKQTLVKIGIILTWIF